MKQGYKKKIEGLLGSLNNAACAWYRDRLVSVVVFGSVARGVPRPDSDVDVLIVCRNLPRGRIKRVSEFQDRVETPLEPSMRALRQNGLNIELSPVFKTPEEVEQGSPLFLDMTRHAKILFDRNDFFLHYLVRLRVRLRKMGARRVSRGNAWYWILKPDYRYGDVIEL